MVAYINTGVVTNTKACNEQTQKSGPAQEPGPAQKVKQDFRQKWREDSGEEKWSLRLAGGNVADQKDETEAEAANEMHADSSAKSKVVVKIPHQAQILDPLRTTPPKKNRLQFTLLDRDTPGSNAKAKEEAVV